MDMRKRVSGAVLFSVAFLQMSVCNGAVHMVGDETGWTTIGNYDYKGWAATKNFQLGDVIMRYLDCALTNLGDLVGGSIPGFVYLSQFHNVMQVSHPQYRSCNVTKPIAAYATGNDSIIVATYGHHYFLCGVPGHCQSGQKVDINVQLASHIAPSPSPSALLKPALNPSNAAKLSSGHVVALLGATAMPFLTYMFL